MDLTELKSFKIGEIDFYAKVTNRAVIEYEAMTSDDVGNLQNGGTEKKLKFFYCCAKAGFKSAAKDFNYTFDQFVDLTDSFYYEVMTKFPLALYKPGLEVKKK